MEEKIIQTLHTYERKVLSVLDKPGTVQEIARKSGLLEIEAMRGIQWLENKKLVKVDEEEKEVVDLDTNGKKYVKEGLPEKRFLQATGENTKISEIKKKANLQDEEVSICLGVLRGKAAITIKKDKELIISILPNGKKLLEKESLEEQFLKKDFPIETKALKDEEKFALDSLKKRKEIVKVEKRP